MTLEQKDAVDDESFDKSLSPVESEEKETKSTRGSLRSKKNCAYFEC